LIDLGRAVRYRLATGRGWSVQQLRQRVDSLRESKPRRANVLTPAVGAGLGVGILLAVLWHHWILSLWFVVLGGAAGYVLGLRHPCDRENLRELEVLVGSLRSVFSVDQSIFVSLETVANDLPEGKLRSMLEEAVRRYRAEPDVERALIPLYHSGWPRLARLAAILRQICWADERAIRDALLDLEANIRDRRRLSDRARTVLALTQLSLRVFQAANVAALAVVTIVPMWNRFYVQKPFTLMTATAMVVAGSWYFASEIRRIEGAV